MAVNGPPPNEEQVVRLVQTGRLVSAPADVARPTTNAGSVRRSTLALRLLRAFVEGTTDLSITEEVRECVEFRPTRGQSCDQAHARNVSGSPFGSFSP